MAQLFSLKSSLANILQKYGRHVNKKSIYECRSLLYLRRDGFSSSFHTNKTWLNWKVRTNCFENC